MKHEVLQLHGTAACCERAMNRFFVLDKGERLPLLLTLHLLSCKDCRTQVRLLTLAERVAARPLQKAATTEDVQQTVEKMRAAYSAGGGVESEEAPFAHEKSPVTLMNWIVGGVLMICFMLVFAFVTRHIESNVLSVSFYLMFAGAVTAYCAFFVGANMDFFVKKIKTFQLSL